MMMMMMMGFWHSWSKQCTIWQYALLYSFLQTWLPFWSPSSSNYSLTLDNVNLHCSMRIRSHCREARWNDDALGHAANEFHGRICEGIPSRSYDHEEVIWRRWGWRWHGATRVAWRKACKHIVPILYIYTYICSTKINHTPQDHQEW